MLLNSVVIVLREVLEAALLLSVLLACARSFSTSNRWTVPALVFGGLGAVAYAYFLEPVSELFDGVGQDICNALLQFTAFALLTMIAFYIPRWLRDPQTHQSTLKTLMISVVAIAMAREGSEILVYVSGFWSISDIFSAVIVGSLVGACIGLSVGILVYFLLLALPSGRAVPIYVVLVILIAAGMSTQATRLLMQADWISGAGALWDTSSILSESSLLGQLLYAFIGYEATPSAAELGVYVSSILAVTASYHLGRFVSRMNLDG